MTDAAMESVLEALGRPDSVTVGQIIAEAERLNAKTPSADLRAIIAELEVWNA